MSGLTKLLEDREDLKLFKKVVHVFGYYCDKLPGTAVEPLYNELLQRGLKCLPSDHVAINVLHYMLDRKLPDASKVGEIMNLRFLDLPADVRPVFLDKDKTETVASWKRGDKIYDRIMSLINLEDGSKGSWVSQSGEAVKLLNNK